MLAAEKMVNPVARRNRVDGGSRGILLWGLLMASLVGHPTNALCHRTRCAVKCLWSPGQSFPHLELYEPEFWGIEMRCNNSYARNDLKIPPSSLRPWVIAVILLAIAKISGVKWPLIFVGINLVSGESPHQPYNWTLIRGNDSHVIQQIVTPGSPSFIVSHCNLLPTDQCRKTRPYYFCPKSNPGKGYCNLPNQYYCAYWDCVTIAAAWEPPINDKFLKVGWGPIGCRPPTYIVYGKRKVDTAGNCKYLYLNVTSPEDFGWKLGKTWGVRYWGYSQGGIIIIKKEEIIIGKPKAPTVSPNQTTKPILLNRTKRVPSTSGKPNTANETNPLWKIIQASYQALNYTNPNKTSACWLCYDDNPPFYEAIGLDLDYSLNREKAPKQCKWEEKRAKIPMEYVKGKGRCIGKVPTSKQELCSVHERRLDKVKKYWIIPPEGGWWICSKIGLTPCISLKIFNASIDYCIQVRVIPRVLYHPENRMYEYWQKEDHHIMKREPITAITIATLLGLGAVGAGTGIASLAQQSQGYSSLRAAVDEDLQRIEKSITSLEKSLTSLSEVVLQNRRGLNLLFLHQGGLCAALGEECCFYADHTGVVRESMAKLREGLEKRQRDRETQQGRWFIQFPGLTAIISTIAGPLVMILLTLTFGPCIFNKVINIVKSRLEAAHLLTLQEYNQVKETNTDANKHLLEKDPTLQAARETIARFDQQIKNW